MIVNHKIMYFYYLNILIYFTDIIYLYVKFVRIRYVTIASRIKHNWLYLTNIPYSNIQKIAYFHKVANTNTRHRKWKYLFINSIKFCHKNIIK
jgi:hypothetical protein